MEHNIVWKPVTQARRGIFTTGLDLQQKATRYERFVMGRNGSLYYETLSDMDVDRAIRMGLATWENGYPKAVKRPWDQIKLWPNI